jgi:hypothetical protein
MASSFTHRVTSSSFAKSQQSSLTPFERTIFATNTNNNQQQRQLVEYTENADGAEGTYNTALANINFNSVSIMPVSCINYHNGHMIKFSYFDKSTSLNCHFKNLGTYIVSIAHYMRTYFNYQALVHGNDFTLPGDVGFLNVSFRLYSFVLEVFSLFIYIFLSYLIDYFFLASHSIIKLTPHSASTYFIQVCSIKRDCQFRRTTLCQNWLSSSRYLHIYEVTTNRIHR